MIRIPDPYRATVTIPVKIKNGKVEFFYGSDLPDIEDDTVADLIVPKHALTDKGFVEKVSYEREVEFIPKGTTLLAAFSIKDSEKLSVEKKDYLKDVKKQYLGDTARWYSFPPHALFAEITLQDSLKLIIRGTKKSILKSCKCELPPFINKIAKRLNHAYTLLSNELEPSRMSHGGNVFTKVFYNRGLNGWIDLDALRSEFEAREEKDHFLSSDDLNQ